MGELSDRLRKEFREWLIVGRGWTVTTHPVANEAAEHIDQLEQENAELRELVRIAHYPTFMWRLRSEDITPEQAALIERIVNGENVQE